MTKTQLIETLSTDVLVQSANELAADLLDPITAGTYYEAIEETFDAVVAELTARGQWYGEWN